MASALPGHTSCPKPTKRPHLRQSRRVRPSLIATSTYSVEPQRQGLSSVPEPTAPGGNGTSGGGSGGSTAGDRASGPSSAGGRRRRLRPGRSSVPASIPRAEPGRLVDRRPARFGRPCHLLARLPLRAPRIAYSGFRRFLDCRAVRGGLRRFWRVLVRRCRRRRRQARTRFAGERLSAATPSRARILPTGRRPAPADNQTRQGSRRRRTRAGAGRPCPRPPG